MKRKFLIFAIYETENNEIYSLHSILELDNFPNEDEVKEYMQLISFNKLKGITGITEVFGDCGW